MHSVNSKNVIRYGLYCLVALVPFTLLFILSRTLHFSFLNMNLYPVWSDELSYWSETLSFAKAGFSAGYFGIDEIIPAILNFGAHGFGVNIFYSLYAFFFGWAQNSIVLANTLYMTIAFAGLVALIKPKAGTLILIIFFYLTYLPILLYAITSMSEILIYALLIAYFSLLYQYCKTKKTVLFSLLIAVCVICSTVRISLIVIFLPVIFIKCNFQFKKRFFCYFAGFIFMALILFSLVSITSAPYPFGFLESLNNQMTLSGKARAVIDHALLNISLFFDWNSQDGVLQIFQRCFYFIIMAMCLFFSFFHIDRQEDNKRRITRNLSLAQPYFIAFCILSVSLLGICMLYDVFDWRDYRSLAPVLFGVLIFLLLHQKKCIIHLAIFLNVAAIITYLAFPQSVSFPPERYVLPDAPNALLSDVQYCENASDPFENTLAVDTFSRDVYLFIDPGIGIEYLSDIDNNAALRSKYLILHTADLLIPHYSIVKTIGNQSLYIRDR